MKVGGPYGMTFPSNDNNKEMNDAKSKLVNDLFNISLYTIGDKYNDISKEISDFKQFIRGNAIENVRLDNIQSSLDSLNASAPALLSPDYDQNLMMTKYQEVVIQANSLPGKKVSLPTINPESILSPPKIQDLQTVKSVQTKIQDLQELQKKITSYKDLIAQAAEVLDRNDSESESNTNAIYIMDDVRDLRTYMQQVQAIVKTLPDNGFYVFADANKDPLNSINTPLDELYNLTQTSSSGIGQGTWKATSDELASSSAFAQLQAVIDDYSKRTS